MSGGEHLIGTTFGTYELIEIAGRGGMSVVYKARQRDIGREVAVKIFTKALSYAQRELNQFEQEARLAAHLDHPHVVSIYDFGVQQGTAYVVMRFLHGGTLAQRLQMAREQQFPLPNLPQVADLTMQVGRAIYHAHTKGVIHRDIKPENIMFDERGKPFIVDFGVATLVDVARHRGDEKLLIGTPSYMAPEHWLGGEITPWTDQYAFGLVIYELLTNKRAFYAQDHNLAIYKYIHEHQMPEPAHRLREDIPEEVARVLQKSYAKHPHHRFRSVLEFAEAFQKAVAKIKAPSQRTDFFTFPLIAPEIPAPISNDDTQPRPATADEFLERLQRQKFMRLHEQRQGDPSLIPEMDEPPADEGPPTEPRRKRAWWKFWG